MMAAESSEARSVVIVTIVCEGGLLVLALVLGWFFDCSPLERVAWTALGVAYGLAAAVPLLVGLVIVTRYPIGPFKQLEAVSKKLILPLFSSCSIGQLLLISAMAGIGEEALFRGVLQAGIEQWSGSTAWALVAASVLFALAHPITPTYGVLAGLIGAYLGWLLVASGNLLVPIMAHAAYDFVALVYLLNRRIDAIEPADRDAGAEDDFGIV